MLPSLIFCFLLPMRPTMFYLRIFLQHFKSGSGARHVLLVKSSTVSGCGKQTSSLKLITRKPSTDVHLPMATPKLARQKYLLAIYFNSENIKEKMAHKNHRKYKFIKNYSKQLHYKFAIPNFIQTCMSECMQDFILLQTINVQSRK